MSYVTLTISFCAQEAFIWIAQTFSITEKLTYLPLTTTKEDVAISARPCTGQGILNTRIEQGVVPGAVIRAETSYHLILTHNP